MKSESKKNLAASVRQRLLTISQQRKEPFDLVLVKFGIERLLYRLSQSRHADKFLLKGAMLFTLWSEGMHRPTRDVDLLGFGESDANELKSVFIDLCVLTVEPDGLTFTPTSVKSVPIRDNAAYPGVRVTMEARLENARVPLQVDIGFGDIVTPEPEDVRFPVILEFDTPKLRAYPVYTVIAEKLEAMVHLGEANTRMKDFFDLWFLSQNFSFEGSILRDAIIRTFERRRTTLPESPPPALSVAFADQKTAAWRAFLSRNGLGTLSMEATLNAIGGFVMPVMDAAFSKTTFAFAWTAKRGWRAAPGTRT